MFHFFRAKSRRVSKFNSRMENMILRLVRLELAQSLVSSMTSVPLPQISFQSAEQSAGLQAAEHY